MLSGTYDGLVEHVASRAKVNRDQGLLAQYVPEQRLRLAALLRAVPNRSRKASGNRAWLENEFRVASFSSFKSFRVASLSAKLPKREIDFGSQLGSEATRRAAAEFCHVSFSHL